MKTKKRCFVTLSLGLALLPCIVSAHHSYAMFDREREITVKGTVKQFQLVNPHCWLDLTETDPHGVSKTWSFEGGSYTQLIRKGIRPSTIKVGDTVTVKAFPLRDGRNGGHIVTLTTRDGTAYEMVPAGQK